MSLTTRKGDQGETGLPGRRLSKACPEIQALGDLDELNSCLGWARAAGLVADQRVAQTQSALLDLGAALASGEEYRADDEVRRMEADTDEAWAALPVLTQFILPGGSEAAARLHVCRAVCRRAERSLVESCPGSAGIAFLNRLSDWLFAMARKENAEAGRPDSTWSKRC